MARLPAGRGNHLKRLSRLFACEQFWGIPDGTRLGLANDRGTPPKDVRKAACPPGTHRLSSGVICDREWSRARQSPSSHCTHPESDTCPPPVA